MKRLLLLFLLVTGCSTFSERECERFDWTTEGQKHALEGRTLSETKSYYDRECRVRHNVAPDLARLEDGYRGGLKEFCTPTYMQNFAARGGEYQGTCAAENESQFLDKYKNTRILFLEKENRDLHIWVDRLRSENASLRASSTLGPCYCPPH